MLEILPIPAFTDNYIWLLHNGTHAVVVDPGDATPVIKVLTDQSLTLNAILITHHHSDHIDGVSELIERYHPTVYAPEKEKFNFPHISVSENDKIQLQCIELEFSVMDIPGHTLGHVAYYGANHLFCGDTLFGAGCGRLFEGTPEQMFDSLQRLAKLPRHTAVYCAHEYTEHNLRFAHMLDTNNKAITKRQQDAAAKRAANLPTLPSTIALELETNPFLRCDDIAIKAVTGLQDASALALFTAIRKMRNSF